MKHKITPFILASAFVFAACSQETTKTANAPQEMRTTGETESAIALPQGFFLSETPANATSVSATRSSAQVGEEVTVTGYIGGRAEPFTDGRAIFLLADSEKAPACGNECRIPWDACCVPGDVVAANSATIQVVDSDGKTLRLGLQGINDLAPGAEITVQGTVHQANDAIFILNANGIAMN
ncbi:hypothetical protein KQI84_18575 [bacterium]|nr:hypothetical protein [bacterium]